MRIVIIGVGVLVVVSCVVLVTVKMFQMDSHLSTSIHLAQNLKAQVSTLWKENFDYREQLRTYGSRNGELEKEKARLASQLKEAQSKQAYLEKIAMEQTTRVKELEVASETLNARDSELGQKDEQLRSLTQEIDVMRLAVRTSPSRNDEARRTEGRGAVQETPLEKNVIFYWNSQEGRVAVLDLRGMTYLAVREKLSASILDLRRDEKMGKPADDGLMADMFYNLGVLSTQHGDHKSAVESFNAALALRSEDADCHYNLAVVYDEKFHNDAMALQHYREYLRLEPNTPELLKIRKWIVDKEAAVMVLGPQ